MLAQPGKNMTGAARFYSAELLQATPTGPGDVLVRRRLDSVRPALLCAIPGGTGPA
jgi:hypothetical protein